MGRTSKFSFPLSGKRTRPTTASSDTRTTRDEQQPLSKAERLLGTSGLALPHSANLSRQNLNSRPGYKSLQVASSSAGDDSHLDDMLYPVRGEEVFIPPRMTSLRHKDSSDVLNAARISDSRQAESTTGSSMHIKGSKSSSTLRSFYDSRKAPFVASQQTSESAIRDGALRKGKPAIVGRLSRAGRDSYAQQSTTSSLDTTEDWNDSDRSRRTTRLGLTRLFPKPSFSNPRLLSPTGSATSLASVPHTSEHISHQPPSPRSHKSSAVSNMRRTGSRFLNRHQNIAPTANPNIGYQRRFGGGGGGGDHSRVKNNVRKPPQGAKNWFDGLLEEEDEADLEMENEMTTPTTRFFSVMDSGSETRLHQVAGESGASEQSDTVYTIRKMASHKGSEYANSSEPTLRGRRPYTPQSPRSNRTKDSILANSDLGDRSVLSTTSSSDGEEEESADESIDLGLPRVRDSIQDSDIDSIHVGKAQAFRVNPGIRPTEAIHQTRRQSDASIGSVVSSITNGDTSSIQSSTAGPTYLAVPARSSRPRKSGHTRQPSSIPEDSDTSQRISSGSPIPSSQSSRHPQMEQHKLMAVTEEEEALLEMMRRKRATMAKQNFAHGYKTALRKTPSKNATKSSISSTISVESAKPPQTPRRLSSSSSILDSFPISRSQRSSLMLAQSASHPNLLATLTDSHSIRSRRRQSQQTSISTASINSYYESPSTTKYAFAPHLSLVPVDVNLSPIPSPTSIHSHDANSASPEPLPSPTTPITRRGSADVIIRGVSSQRDSQASFGMPLVGLAKSEIFEERLKKETHRHSRRRTASSDANIMLSDSESSGKGDTVDPALQKTANRLSLASTNNRSSVASLPKASSSVVTSTSHAPLPSYSTFPSKRDSYGYSRDSVMHAPGIGTRCSVSEDVLAAWGSLGGWRDQQV